MKILRTFVLFAAFTLLTGSLFASEVSDLFADRLPKMSSGNLDEKKNAQQDWQNFCRQNGNDPTVRNEINKLTVEQLDKDNPAETKAWLIRQIGLTGDASVVPALAKCLTNDDVQVKDEAAKALAMNPSKEAESALKASKSQISKDALHERNIDRMLMTKTGNETKMPMAIPYASEKAVSDWMKGYDKLGDLEKAQTLANLTVRRDGKYIQQALAGLKSDNDALRDAAILAVGAMGSSRQIPVLLEQAFDGKNKDLAKLALSRMTDRMLDAQLLGQLNKEKDAGRFETIADILKQRDNAAAMPVIMERAQSDDSPNRLALIRIAENFASKDDAADFVNVWEKITDRGQKDQAEQIIARLVGGDAEPVIKKRTDSNYAAMFSLLGRIGDEKSLEEIRNRVFEKPLTGGMKASPELKAAALRAMCNWPDGRVVEDLLGVAGDDKFSDGDRVSALRAFARVASLPNDQIKIKAGDKEKVDLLTKGMDIAKRVDEKRLILQRAGQVRHGDSLRFIMKHFDDPDLQHQVCWSVVDLAHHTWLRDSAKDDFKAALDKVISTSKDQNQLDRAKRYRAAMQ